MSIQHPIDGETLYNVQEAAAWLTERGRKTAKSSLNTKRSRGGGPRYIEIGPRRWYRESALREYLLSKISGEFSNTSEMKAARSSARPNGGGA
jgi:hypothetical protein